MLTRISGASLVVAFASVANAGMVDVELIPDNPGPYYGGESLTVDVWLHSQVDYDVRLAMVQLDFTDTDPNVLLEPQFAFDFKTFPPEAGYLAWHSPDLPVPSIANFLDCYCPGSFRLFPGNGSVHIGSIHLGLPGTPGDYILDALNADEVDQQMGAGVLTAYAPAPHEDEFWRAYAEDLTGGSHPFEVVPEPGTLALLLVSGVFLILRTRQTAPRS